MIKRQFLLLAGAAILGVTPAMASLTVTLTPNAASPQPLGSTITWTAAVVGDPDSAPVYEYSFGAEAQGAPVQVRKGFGHSATWTWTPVAFEGAFNVHAVVKNVHSGNSGSTAVVYTLTSRLVSGHAVVNTTNHPLVAFFSAPACQTPNFMRVRFTPSSAVPAAGISTAVTTSLAPCRFNVASGTPDSTSMNFYVAGMYPNTQYNMHWETVNPSGMLLHAGTDMPFTAGTIPGNVHFPAFSSTGLSTDTKQPLVLYSIITIPVNGTIYTSAATDLAGNVLWYSTLPPVRTEQGGNYLGFVNGGDQYVAGIREADLAGNAVLETTVGAVNEQLVAMGARPITAMHHEIRRIFRPNGTVPNGYLLTLGSTEQITTSAQGGTPTTPVDVIGDEIIVLDSNLNVVWTWDAFKFLDINQVAILHEQCTQPAGAGCEPFNPAFSVANDWLHSNSAQYTSYDGNIVFSMRHQDAVMKVNFTNGTGDGHIIWKMGNGPIGGPGGAALPTFTLTTVNTQGSTDLAYPSFTHQHDAEFELQGTVIGGSRVMTIYDDGNTRQANFDPAANGRCQLWAVNESALAANLNTNGDMGTFSFAVGSAQLLANGSIACDSGFIGGFPLATTNPQTQTVEFQQSGNVVYTAIAGQDSYRSFRMADLFTAITP